MVTPAGSLRFPSPPPAAAHKHMVPASILLPTTAPVVILAYKARLLTAGCSSASPHFVAARARASRTSFRGSKDRL